MLSQACLYIAPVAAADPLSASVCGRVGGQHEGRPDRMLQTYNAVQSGVLVDRGHNRAARDYTQYQFLHVV